MAAHVAGQQNANEDQPRLVIVRLACNATENAFSKQAKMFTINEHLQSRAGLDSTIEWPPICNHQRARSVSNTQPTGDRGKKAAKLSVECEGRSETTNRKPGTHVDAVDIRDRGLHDLHVRIHEQAHHRAAANSNTTTKRRG